MGLSSQLSGIVPANVTYGQARAVWRFGVTCAEQALAAGQWEEVSLPGRQTRENSLAVLMTWEGTWSAVEAAGQLGEQMDYSNWDTLRTQVVGAAANLDAIAEGNATAQAALLALPVDMALNAAHLPGAIAGAAGELVGAVGAGLVKGGGLTGVVLLGAAGLLAFFLLRKGV